MTPFGRVANQVNASIRLKTIASFALLISTTGLFILMSSEQLAKDYTPRFIKGSSVTEGDGENYKNRLLTVADKNNIVILTLIDLGFVEFAINFWETSIVPFGITNMLFVSVSRKACQILGSSNIPCHVYKDISGGESASSFPSPVYLEKINIRTVFILDALYWEFTVLSMDADMIFLANPLDSFVCNVCDFEILEDAPGILNAGFVYLRPFPATVKIYRQLAILAEKNPDIEDQTILNEIIKKMNFTVKYHTLDSTKFSSGRKYYELPQRYFADTAEECAQCKVIHNNWMVGKAGRIYRQKEMLQWLYDGDRYYSDRNRKYLMFNNTILTNADDKANLEISKRSLLNAFSIGKILNRIVLLPRFYCKGVQCPLNSYFNITHFDIYFGSEYRESTFLLHPKVPQTVKDSISETYAILSSFPNGKNIPANLIVKTPNDKMKGATSDEIFKWFGENDRSVLKFHTLQDAFKEFSNRQLHQEFEKKANDAFRIVTYRQKDLNDPTNPSKCPQCY